MNKKEKRNLLIGIGVIEAVLIIFCLVVSIIVLATLKDTNLANEANGPFISYLQNHPTVFFCAFVLPLFIILVVDGIYLIYLGVHKQGVLSDDEMDKIKEEAKKQAREEVLKEINKEEK